MLIDNVKTTYPEPFIKIREDKRGDWSEIGVYVDPVIPTAGNVCIAVITHPCAGAKWFIHATGLSSRGIPCRTRQYALELAINAARQSAAYKHHTKGA